MNITQRPSPNMTKGRNGWTPDIIVCHITDGAFDGAVSWVTNPSSQVSYHYLVARDGRIVNAVDIRNTAWANGTNNSTDGRGNMHSRLATVRERKVNANLYTVSVGFEGRHVETGGSLTQIQLDAGVWLINQIRKNIRATFGTENLIPANRNHIVGHVDITPRWRPNCPGASFPFDEIIMRLGREGTAAVPALPISNTPSRWASNAWEWAIQAGITDGTNPQGTATREQMIQLLYNFSHYL